MTSSGGGCTCGCCGVAVPEAALSNPPGLAALAFRSGTHNTVLARMLAGLPAALPTLAARTGDDPGVALLDAWATVADVITFYQERIANEGYLRTATERASVLELARMIGYELRPGVAAQTYLDFRVETAPGAPRSSVLPAGTKVRSVPTQGRLPQTFETSAELIALADLNEVALRRRAKPHIGKATTSVLLAGLATGLRAGDAILVGDGSPGAAEFRILSTVTPHPARSADEPATTEITWDGVPQTQYQPPEVHALRLRATLFGATAPDWNVLPDDIRKRYVPAPPAEEQPAKAPLTPEDFPDWPGIESPLVAGTTTVDLDGAHPAVVPGSWLVLRGTSEQVYKINKAEVYSRSAFAISGPVTRVTLDRTDQLTSFKPRTTTVYTQSEQLTLADAPLNDLTVDGKQLDLDRPAPFVPGQPVIVAGLTDAGEQAPQVAEIESADPQADPMTITLKAELDPPLKRHSVRIAGNVVAATHGETVTDEVLGSGDGAATNQRFTLKKPDLTHVQAGGPSGAGNSLEVYVDGLRWTEVPSLFLAGPYDRVYVVRIDDDAKATVIFGDGERGARLPTGLENVHARYRSGIGLAGLVGAGALTLLPQRPLGISGVGNPLDPGGASEPETTAGARANAPLAVLTLDRVVSLRDYEDYARAYGGIVKARAVALSDGRSPFVHITVAGPGGTAVDTTTIDNLLDALDTVLEPSRIVRVDSYRSRLVTIGVAILADPARRRADVVAAVTAALLEAYAIHRRGFAQPVTRAEVLAVVQGVPGVVAARITALHADGEADAEVVPVRDAEVAVGGTIRPAELLLTDPAHIKLSEMTP